ncbi:hypothetical protein K438DRAFT_760026 [Mycena galopus ATCC 62051]|nr:hypothetical protein K438DRAFT_824058 [Mycena galopus ATCC 62051]KAF8196397.1 hypothetical protein K438DRAFT_760026 [Mycena galopus ATCC 62051]
MSSVAHAALRPYISCWKPMAPRCLWTLAPSSAPLLETLPERKQRTASARWTPRTIGTIFSWQRLARQLDGIVASLASHPRCGSRARASANASVSLALSPGFPADAVSWTHNMPHTMASGTCNPEVPPFHTASLRRAGLSHEQGEEIKREETRGKKGLPRSWPTRYLGSIIPVDYITPQSLSDRVASRETGTSEESEEDSGGFRASKSSNSVFREPDPVFRFPPTDLHTYLSSENGSAFLD